MELDLDAYRAARAETQEARKLTLGGVVYDLPAEVPVAVLEDFGEGRVIEGLKALGGDDFAAACRDNGLTSSELTAIFTELYGVTPGN